MKECPHIEECKQKIDENAFYLCLGELDEFDYEKCFSGQMPLNEVSEETEKKSPREWDNDLGEE